MPQIWRCARIALPSPPAGQMCPVALSGATAMPCGSASAIFNRWGPTADLRPGFAVGEICFAGILGCFVSSAAMIRPVSALASAIQH
jgi:hypothetical protein